MWTAIKSMLGSKKFIAAVVGAIVWFVSRLGAHLDATEATAAITPLLAYILGQGVADQGKPAAIVNAVANNQPYPGSATGPARP